MFAEPQILLAQRVPLRLLGLALTECLHCLGNRLVQESGGEVMLHHIVLRPSVQGLHCELFVPLSGQQYHGAGWRG